MEYMIIHTEFGEYDLIARLDADAVLMWVTPRFPNRISLLKLWFAEALQGDVVDCASFAVVCIRRFTS